MSAIIVAALYQFSPLPDFAERRDELHKKMEELGIFGTILLAAEGVNGTIAGPRQGIDELLQYLRAWPGFEELEHKESHANKMPFQRQKVKLKKEIVTMGLPGIDPNEIVGEYIEPAQWNELLSDPDVVLIDTRNDYEVAFGSFQQAINPKTESFREFPDWFANREEFSPDRTKIAMFCTGGIRCEKASSFVRQQGFEHVYHLKGGILKYLEEVPKEQSLWEGDCFVFDERVTVGHGLETGKHSLCGSCHSVLTEEDRASALYEDGTSCPSCHEGALK